MSEPPKKPPGDEPAETPPAAAGGYSATARSRYRRASAAGAVDATPFRFGPPPDEPPTIVPAPPRATEPPTYGASPSARYRSASSTSPADEEPAATHGSPSARYRAATATQPVPDAIPRVIVDGGGAPTRQEDSQAYRRARATTPPVVDPSAPSTSSSSPSSRYRAAEPERASRDTMPDPSVAVAEFVATPIDPPADAPVAVAISIEPEPIPSTVDVVIDQPLIVSPPEPVPASDAVSDSVSVSGSDSVSVSDSVSDAVSVSASGAVSVSAPAAAPAEPEVIDAVPPDILGPRRVVDVTTYHLETFHRPTARLLPPSPGIAVVHAVEPGPRFYRYLYDTVGAPWHWYDRRRMTPAQLTAIVNDPRVEVHVLTDRGVPIGYAELDRRVDGEAELAYFGLFPEAIGRGLGAWFLRWTMAEAWRPPDVARVWVHTCTLDHPAALPLYLAAGFVQFDEERHRQTIAR
jgi:GNAT superfamily N-acetyltransferase